MFWPVEKIAAWKAIFSPLELTQDGVETIENLVTLSTNARCIWNMGAFALKPISISEDRKTLTVQFFWQVKQPSITSDIDLLNLNNMPQSTKDTCNFSNSSLYRSFEPAITTGQLFEIRTDDPDKKPLPSMALLEMQWFLNRVMGIAGVGTLSEGTYYWDDNISPSDPATPALNSLNLQTPKQQEDEMEVERG